MSASEQGVSPRRMFAALWRYKHWVPIAIVCGPLWTAVHESAHALAAVAQGARIVEMRVLPGFMNESYFAFGWVRHTGVPNEHLVHLAPVIAALVIGPLGLLALRRAAAGVTTRFAFLMLVLFPIGEISNSTAALAFGRGEADLSRALGNAGPLAIAILFALMAALGFAARPVFERLFAPGLSRLEYVLLGGAVALAPLGLHVFMGAVRALGWW